MTRKERRRATRRPAGWITGYNVEGSRDGWSRCEVVDVSESGAGLVISGTAVEKDMALTLELAGPDGDPGPTRLQGIVRHATTSPDGTMHIGVEFEPDQATVVVVPITDELWTMFARV